MNNSEQAKRLAEILITTRDIAGKSQEDMALELGVSRSTIINWEKGVSKCDLTQLYQWFEVLEINPVPYIIKFFSPTKYSKMSSNAPDDMVNDSMTELITSLSTEAQRCILYLLYDITGDPFAMIQLFVAHAHLPMAYRFSIANNICEIYKMCEADGTLRDINKILPDVELLEHAIKAGKNAAINGKSNYNLKDEL